MLMSQSNHIFLSGPNWIDDLLLHLAPGPVWNCWWCSDSLWQNSNTWYQGNIFLCQLDDSYYISLFWLLGCNYSQSEAIRWLLQPTTEEQTGIFSPSALVTRGSNRTDSQFQRWLRYALFSLYTMNAIHISNNPIALLIPFGVLKACVQSPYFVQKSYAWEACLFYDSKRLCIFMEDNL